MKIYYLFILLAAIASGCVSSKPSRFYTLTPARETTGKARTGADSKIAISIRTLKLPDYLLHQQMVKRMASNEIHFAEFDRWAEPLENNFSRVLMEDLSADVPTNNISLFPVQDASLTNYQLILDVTEFERNASGALTLSARWSIIKGEGANYLTNKRSSFTEQVSGEGYDMIASAMSDLTAKLSSEIAEEIRARVASGQ
jgi:uncharacterized lipoprotein YmbA